jgi:hypothetical protein
MIGVREAFFENNKLNPCQRFVYVGCTMWTVAVTCAVELVRETIKKTGGLIIKVSSTLIKS